MRNTGDRLKECRIMKGLSRGEMSEMLNVSTDYLARLEQGHNRLLQDYREGGKLKAGWRYIPT
ncbi:MAG: helix-turn-helix domain-containing protein [Lachnospira eligens]